MSAEELSPRFLLAAYAQGLFPMADEAGQIAWFSPDPRTIFDLDGFHASRTLRQLYRQRRFRLSVDESFPAVVTACAERQEGTWISSDIIAAYTRLHELGFAHSVETWLDDRLVGGLYGVALGGAFFGESMFHRASNASKVALVHLVERLRVCGFTLLDTQFTTAHLMQFGTIEIPRREYLRRLDRALRSNCVFRAEEGEW